MMRADTMPAADTRAILADLIAFETVSGSSTEAINAYIAGHCEARAYAVIRAPGPNPAQQNIAFRFGPDAPGGIVLSGHTDVVPVEDQNWTHPPFAATEENDRLYAGAAAT